MTRPVGAGGDQRPAVLGQAGGSVPYGKPMPDEVAANLTNPGYIPGQLAETLRPVEAISVMSVRRLQLREAIDQICEPRWHIVGTTGVRR